MENFFERQDEARQNTTQLVVIYGVTVLLVVLGLYATVVLLLEYGVAASIFESGSALEAARATAYGGDTIELVQPWVLVIVSAATLAFIGGAGFRKLEALRGGGRVVARRLYGTKIDPTQAMGTRRQLLNVVEEMAVAAGVPAPPVYVLPERGINAFSAGFTQDDAVIGVTQGAIDHLSRHELQGLVAHEFSHILNGDMRLNLRLMSWTRGIELIRDLGKGVVWAITFFPIRLAQAGLVWIKGLVEQIRGLASKGIVGLIILVVMAYFFGGFVIMVPMLFLGGAVGSGIAIFQFAVLRYAALIGAAGAVLGGLGFLGVRLIKAQVSREREFLADAAAVQFTRNPAGIGGALLKLRDCDQSGRITSGNVGNVRHLFFGAAVEPDGGLAQWLPTPLWLSTHPPIEDRIRHVDPSLLKDASPREHDLQDEAPSADAVDAPLSPDALIERAGTLSPEMLTQAQALHAALPNELLDAAHEPLGAVTLSYALMLDEDASMRSQQLDLLWKQEAPPVFDEVKRLYDRVADLDRSLRLPLVEVAAPSLRELSPDQQDQLRKTIRTLAEADDRLTIFEFALQTIVRHYLDHLDHPDHAPLAATTPGVWDEVAVLLSGMARAGHETESEAQGAFEAAYDPLAEAHGIGPVHLASAPPDAVGAALDRLARTPLNLRKEILQGGARCAMADGTITQTEEELLRAVAVALGVPLPVSASKETASSVGTDEASGEA